MSSDNTLDAIPLSDTQRDELRKYLHAHYRPGRRYYPMALAPGEVLGLLDTIDALRERISMAEIERDEAERERDVLRKELDRRDQKDADRRAVADGADVGMWPTSDVLLRYLRG